jgi:hypothetical protein
VVALGRLARQVREESAATREADADANARARRRGRTVGKSEVRSQKSKVSSEERMSKVRGFIVCIVMAAAVAVSAMQTGKLTNTDIISLAKAGMGDAVIIAKIKQASSADFKLEVADLKALKAAGVSDAVISEMLNKGSGTAPAASAPAASKPAASAPAASNAPMGPNDADTVYIVTKDGKRYTLRSAAGTMSSTYAYVTMLMHSNFDGLKADTRITDHKPSFVMRSYKSPKGRLWLVSAEVDAKNNVRSVKMGNSKIFGAKNIGAPDSSNQIEADIVADPNDQNGWKITPKKDLKAGEYGLWMNTNEMFDFGIDDGAPVPPPATKTTKPTSR